MASLATVPQIQLAVCDPAPAPAARELAARLGLSIEAAPGPWLGGCDRVLSCVVGPAALDVARACLPFMTVPGTSYADFTTADPGAMREAGRLAAARGVAFLDVAILGAIAATGAKTPLIAAGDDAASWQDLMAAVGAHFTALPCSTPGDAVALKLLRSAFTKSLEAVTVEVLVAAERRGLRTAFYDVVSDIGGGALPAYLETLIRTHVVHADRRRREVVEVQRQFEAAGLVSDVLPGVEASFARTAAGLADASFAGPMNGLEDALRWLIGTRSAPRTNGPPR